MTPAEHEWGLSEAADQVWALVVGYAPDEAGVRPLMVLQAYIDDSRKDGMVILAGHIASAENWALLARDWHELLPLARLNKQGRREFKMSQMMATPEGMRDIQPFYRLIEKYVAVSLSVYVNERDIERALARIIVSGDQSREWETAYNKPFTVAYRYLMDNFHSKRANFAHLIDASAPVDFIFDQDGAGPVLMAGWEEYVEKRDPAIRDLYGATPVFRDSEKFLPVQAADLWAGWVRRCYETGNIANIAKRDFESWKGKPHPIMRKECTQDELVKAFTSLLRSVFGSGPIIYDYNS